ncbi:MAG: hypothetical protein HYV47_02610 [Candidatus Nealsonbacteria bacterium]|nr:hypothetical protein [Candidatus Nealsonbacteria bacterium]
MAIIFTEERKKQRYLILALTLIIFSILFVVWLGLSRGEEAETAVAIPITYPLPEVEINWQALENIRGKTPQPFAEIGEFKGRFGRDNPFIPY